MIFGPKDQISWFQVRRSICSAFYEFHWFIAAVKLAVADILDLDHISTDIASVDLAHIGNFHQLAFLLVTV